MRQVTRGRQKEAAPEGAAKRVRMKPNTIVPAGSAAVSDESAGQAAGIQAPAGPGGTYTHSPAANEPLRPAHAAGGAPPQGRLAGTGASADTLAGKRFAEAMEYPPGVAGDIASFLYHSAPRPLEQVAIVGALAWLSGVCGAAFETETGSGLNLYQVLIAASGRGKEWLHEGPGLLNRALFRHPGDGEVTTGGPATFEVGPKWIEQANEFFCFDDFASGSALAKYCAKHPNRSFCNFVGEWGHKLSTMSKAAESGGSSHMQTLRRVITNLYHKAGRGSVAGGVRYADEKMNAAAVDGIAYSFVGETTPDTFYEALTYSMLADGFLSRFITTEYIGPRPKANEARVLVPPKALVAHLQDLLVYARDLGRRRARQTAVLGIQAQKQLNDFDDECDDQVNAADSEAITQPWNRAHLKALRVACLLAAAQNPLAPEVTGEQAEWALGLVRRDISRYLSRLQSGDIGQGDDERMKKLLHLMHEFLSQPLAPGYGVPQQMQTDGIVPRKYLQIRAARIGIFKTHRFGAKRALDDAIANCLDNGHIVEMPKEKAGELYTFQGRCYRIVVLPEFT
jgi:Protein of unknown function (DUF3987)